jgi:thiol-disulfide isomerase/thioredoxin
MTTRRWLIIIALLAVTAGVSLAAWRYASHLGDSDAVAADAEPASAPSGEKVALRFFRDPPEVPATTMHDLDGRSISSADWRGKVTIVNFWATWCPPCRAEIPDLIALQKKYGDRLQIIGVSDDEISPAEVKKFAVDHGMNYPIVMSTPELKQVFAGVNALPTSFIVNREGRVVQRHIGMLNAAVTEQETRALAGLSVNATIEEVERGQPAHLENLAQATSIPGVDLSKLSPERRMEALQKLNTEPCTCGCENTVAKCRIDDPKCTTSLPLAKKIVEEIAAKP